MAQPPLPSLLAPGAKARNLDLAALLAIASHEGASGRIGDNGHAFGPFQLNDAGGVLTGKFPGWTPEQKNAWAWSPAGINYAEDGIAKVAAGQHGAQAINSIASKFERPANVQAEIQDALAHYGKGAGTFAPMLPGPPSPTPPGAAAGTGGNSLLGSLVGSTNEMVGLGANPTLSSLLAGSGRTGATATPASPAGGVRAGLPTPAGHGGLAELLREGTGGPTHSTGPHIHAAFTDPKLELAAITWAQQHGLHVGENPYVGDVAPGVHAKNSYHYRTFPGAYNGRKLGQAIDVSGGNTNAFYNFLAGRR